MPKIGSLTDTKAGKTYVAASAIGVGFDFLSNEAFADAAESNARAQTDLFAAKRLRQDRDATLDAAYAIAADRLSAARSGVRGGITPRGAKLLARAAEIKRGNAAAARIDALNLLDEANQLKSRYRKASFDSAQKAAFGAAEFAELGV